MQVFFAVLLLAIAGFADAQADVVCNTFDITLSTQEEVDNFQAAYGGGGTCDTIAGNFRISGSDITNTDALLNLKSIGGFLSVSNNASLTDIDGLSGLTAITGVGISYNASLTDIGGLSGLTTTLTSVAIQGNSLLTTLSGLSIYGPRIGLLSISQNLVLADLQGLENLEEIGTLFIRDNPSLSDITALSNVRLTWAGSFPGPLGCCFGGEVTIERNSSLEDCSPLRPLLGYPEFPYAASTSNVVGPLNIANNGYNASSPNHCLTGFNSGDNDEDGVPNEGDAFPDDPAESTDGDLDGVGDNSDICPETAQDTSVDSNGCAPEQADDDNDGISNASDRCPETPIGENVNLEGCADSDQDGVANADDAYPDVPLGSFLDSDGDGAPDICVAECEAVGMVSDAFPSYPNEWLDSDGDGYGDNLNGSCLDYNTRGVRQIEMSTQTEVDNFQKLVGPCEHYDGSLFLQTCWEEGCDAISDISGTEALTSTSGYFSIGAQDVAEIPIMALRTIGGFSIKETINLQSLAGLEALEQINGSVSIQYNNSLTDLSALNGVAPRSQAASIFINGNSALQSLDGLDFLSGGASYLQISENIALKNIDALRGLTSVSARFIIEDNPQLLNLDGLSSLAFINDGDGQLPRVVDNAALADCTALAKVLGWPVRPWDAETDYISGNFFLGNNAPGANSPDECLAAYGNLDDDTDGITNDKDQCPITDTGERVGADGCKDSDGDGLSDIAESQLGTDPLVRDTDGDGYSDGDEVDFGTDPLSSDDSPLPTGLPIWLLYEATKN